jgi:glucokinase
MKRFFLLIIGFTFFLPFSSKNKIIAQEADYTKYVDPFIGTGFHGHVFLGANVPFGAVQVGPTNYASQKVDNQGSADEILESWITALKASISKIEKSQLAGIGFAMPGPFEYNTGIARFTDANAKYQNLFGIDVGKYVKKKLDFISPLEVRFMNDATAFAVGEAWAGKASMAKRSLSITLGTGFGSAFIDNGIPIVEHENVPKMGCGWHLPFKDSIADDYFYYKNKQF